MSAAGPNDSERALHEERFQELFGVTEADLVAAGVDPDQYARDHVHDALKDQTKWDGILPASNQYGILWTRWGFRCFLAIFVGIGFLALSRVTGLHWLGIGLACAAGLVAVAMCATSLVFKRKQTEAKRRDA